jgi:hypothetical protein
VNNQNIFGTPYALIQQLNNVCNFHYSTATSDVEAINFQISPNPSSGIFSVKTDKNLKINVFNTIGKLILKKEISDGSEVDLSNTSAGVYFYQIQSIDNQEIIKKGKLVKL